MKAWRFIIGFVVLVFTSIWIAIFSFADERLHLIACDVGQGDAILITYKNTQVLTDGGPDKKVLDCLSKYMPFWDRKIELVVLTHPQKDHFGGLIEVIRRYKVENFLENDLEVSSQGYEVLEKEVGDRGVRVLDVKEVRGLRFDKIDLDIVSMSSEVLGSLGANVNNLSIVTWLKFGEFDAILTGDIEKEVSNMLSEKLVTSDSRSKVLSDSRSIEYIKIPHHGSKNGTSASLLEVLRPKVAVISVGKNNSYGHPHEEALKMLSDYDIKILRTDEEGDIEIVTDGKRWGVKDN